MVGNNIHCRRTHLGTFVSFMVFDNIHLRPIAVTAAVLLAAAALTGYYMLGADSGLYPRCMFLQLTGWQCPGCGSQRALHALLHGHFAQAWHYNAMLFILTPLIIALTAASGPAGRRYPKLHHILNSRTSILIILIAITGWTIFRNLYHGS